MGSELTIDTSQEIGDITGTVHFEPIGYPLSTHWRLHPQLASYSDFHWMLFGLPSQIDLPPTCFRQCFASVAPAYHVVTRSGILNP